MQSSYSTKNLVLFNESQAIVWNELELDPCSDTSFTDTGKAIFTTCYDKNINSLKTFDFYYFPYFDTIESGDWKLNEWHKINPKRKDLTKKDRKFIEKMEKLYPEIKEANLNLTLKSETKTINNIVCKQAVFSNSNQTFIVWYRDDINYSWCFDGFLNKVPGTPVLVENENETILEFLDIQNLNFDNIPFNQSHFNEVLKQWK